METEPVAGPEFARALATDGAFDHYAYPERPLVVVDARGVPDPLEPRSLDRLSTLPAVVVALGDGAAREAEWPDLVLDPGPGRAEALERVVATVASFPLASATLALLLRGAADRPVADGLVAESTAYGLLQGGPEFAAWRAGRTARRQDPTAGPVVLVERSGDELAVTLNRPHRRNALDSSMRDALVDALAIAALDPSVTVRLTGAGSSFCSGGDLDEFGSRSDPASAHLLRLARSPARSLAEVADRVVVHLHGDVVGSGIELAAFARRVVAAPDTRISLPEVRLGLVPGAGGTVSLPRRIGRRRTLFLALATESIDATTALDWGLVDALDDR
jgi:hypothetical protein